MANMLREAFDYLADVQNDHAGTTVSYSRSGTGSVTLTVAGGEQALRNDLNGMVRTDWANRDFIVLVADLTISSTAISPRRGDRITIADTDAPDNGDVYEVQAQPEEPPARLIEHGLRWLIHAKRLS